MLFAPGAGGGGGGVFMALDTPPKVEGNADVQTCLRQELR